MKYFIPEWNDRVDPKYDFARDIHSAEHVQDPVNNDVYMWEIFEKDDVPIDGVLISRIVVEQDRRRYEQTLSEGIRAVLRLPQNFKIIGDSGAFGYVKEKVPLYDPIEILQYYTNLGFDYGVTVDHLVVPQFEKDKYERMRITYENGLKAYQEWSKSFKGNFQLLVAIQGWDIQDYVKMYKNYMNRGISYLAFGGLARSPTVFIMKLIEQLVKEIKESLKIPTYLHFFGLARFALFPKFQELEDLGIEVSFDSASYLRKAWLSTPFSQLNYLTIEGKGYAAVRIPFLSKRQQRTKQLLMEKVEKIRLINLEMECLKKLKQYDKGERNLEEALFSLSELNRAMGKEPQLIEIYERTLKDRPWKSCSCPICKSLGIDVIIFRGNNRNRRRGFHNTYVFYQILQNCGLWQRFIKRKKNEQFLDLSALKRGEKVLIITECSKEKKGYDIFTKSVAKEMYKGRLFQTVRNYCETMGFDYVIISAKYGILFPNDEIQGYEKALRTKEDIKNIQCLVEEKLKPLLYNYNKVIVIAGKAYRDVLQNVWDDRFYVIKSKGYGDLCRIIKESTRKQLSLLEFA